MSRNKAVKYKIPAEVMHKMHKSSFKSFYKSILWLPFLLLFIVGILTGIFLLLLNISKHFLMGVIPWQGVPWLYLGLYIVTLLCAYFFFLFAKKSIEAIKHKSISR